ncbi:hypothetical protein LWI28_025389 [Acer negundo]|uniref:Retrovirus-related Pol polyprotein from transposon TNT 1-94 n=1 Tax=Acer negundo TaxID=4023 RepID=A0AAD5P5X5_ACENE|nr:hypothetical protein LWI28_025389 [Acer negundo]
MTMTEYLTKKKSIFDALTHTGYLISEEDKIMYVLSGLGSEYDPFVIPITSMKSCYSMLEITALLLTHEVRIDQNMQVESLNVNMAVNKKGGQHINNGQMAAMLATPETVADQMWYPKSGATDHCTSDGGNLMNKIDYQGKKKIFMGNGSVLQQQVIVNHVPSLDQVADTFTKALPTPRFLYLRSKLSVIDVRPSLRGDVNSKSIYSNQSMPSQLSSHAFHVKKSTSASVIYEN